MFEYLNVNSSERNQLVFDNVSYSWQGNKKSVIKNCSFSISEPGLFMLVGRNGCGKSTLIKLIKGIINPSKGYISSPEHIAMVFQNPDHQILMPTCGSELILNIKGQMSKKEIYDKVQYHLCAVGLEGFLKRPIHTLSGGQKQRLAIASAIISESDFILMDEPTALLDQFSQHQILKIVKSITNNNPITVLWITHRLDELRYSDKVSSMKNGKISIWQNPHNFKYI